MKNMMARWTVEERTRAVDIKPASEERMRAVDIIKPASGTSSHSSGREVICLYFCILYQCGNMTHT